MRVTFWGTRGSVPTPGPSTVRYGGNTACVQASTDDGAAFIFDSGTGIRELGLHLSQQSGRISAHILLGHTHWDHISGFPFFAPAFVPGNRFVLYGARDLDRSLRDVLSGQMEFAYFPVPLGDLRADLDFRELDEGQMTIDGASVQAQYLNHTAVCMGYRLEADGVALAYISDHEPYGLPVAAAGQTEPAIGAGLRTGFIHGGDRRLVNFVQGVDLLIQDTQYTPEEYVAKRGWGHGTTDYVADVAVQARVRRLALFHHEPTHDDAAIDRMVAYTRDRAREAGSAVDVFAAAEGLSLVL